MPAPPRDRADAVPAPVLLPANDPLVDALAEWRRKTCRAEGVPAYRVLPNAALLALAESQPRTVAGLLAVKGIGPARAEAYGLALLRCLARARRASAARGTRPRK